MRKILFLLLLLPIVAFGQKKTQVDLSNPNATLYTHIYFLQNNSYYPSKSAKTIYGKSDADAIDIAVKIKRVLDGKGLLLDFNKVPKDPNYLDTLGYETTSKYVVFPERMPLISVEKKGEFWYFSEETVDNIDLLYAEVFPWYIDKIQEIVPAGHRKFLGVEIWQYVSLLVLITLSILLMIVTKRIVYRVLSSIYNRFIKSNNETIKVSLKKLAHPIALLVVLGLFDKIFPSLQFNIVINKWVFLSINIAAIVFWIYVFLKLSVVIVTIYKNYSENTDGKLDDQLVPILKNFLDTIIVLVGLFKILLYFGVDPATVIAGASIGGLAVAFAAQDTVKNFFGTIMIFLDKPFRVGDWITAGEVTGTVEEVGFRSTRIRAVDTTVFQMPNSKLSELTINNAGLRVYRRYNTNLGLRYDTPPELIEAFVKGVREIILAHPDTRDDAYNVEFVGFGDSALLILMNMYFKDLAWAKEQESKHQIHIAIVKLAKAIGVDFAFPSTTVIIEQFPEKKGFDMNYNGDTVRINDSIAEVIETFKKDLKA